MPLWVIYHSSNIFTTAESKQALAKDITKIYTDFGMPAFYVVTNFIPLASEDMLVGGQPKDKPFVRISADHIAVHMQGNAEAHRRMVDKVDATLKPHIEDKGYDWEYHIDETERALWKVNGLIPPPYKSDDEKVWVKANKPTEWSGARL